MAHQETALRGPVAGDAPATAAARVLHLFEGRRLTPTQRRIAQCLAEHAAEAAYLSSSEVAGLAGVSQPSVTRLAAALGYPGYPALRRRFREAVAHGQPGDAADTRRNEWQKAVAGEIANLTALLGVLADARHIEDVGARLMNSRPLAVVGLRASAPLAGYFSYFAAKVHPDVRLIGAGGTLAADRLEQARDAGASAVLAVVLPRYPAESMDLLRYARSIGLTVVAITDSPVSPVATEADVLLPAAVGSDLVFDSHASAMVLAMVLLQAMCDAAPGGSQARLEEFESSAAARQIFTG